AVQVNAKGIEPARIVVRRQIHVQIAFVAQSVGPDAVVGAVIVGVIDQLTAQLLVDVFQPATAKEGTTGFDKQQAHRQYAQEPGQPSHRGNSKRLLQSNCSYQCRPNQRGKAANAAGRLRLYGEKDGLFRLQRQREARETGYSLII